MGTILRASCEGCGLQAELYVGGGMQDCRPETAIRLAPGRPDFTEAIEQGARFRVERRVSSCPQCRKLAAAVRVSCQRPGLAELILSPRCPDCGERLLWPPREPETVRCPVCGQDIPLRTAGHWD